MAGAGRCGSVFLWVGPGTPIGKRLYYQSFQLNDMLYTIEDTVYLYPEDESFPHYIGRIVSAFLDEEATGDPHCVEVKWYERRVNLEQSTRGIEESEREVFELEETDINPIGCISGKNCVIRASGYDEAASRMTELDQDWYFCRGYFLQKQNAFQAYTPVELEIPNKNSLVRPQLPIFMQDMQLPAADDLGIYKPQAQAPQAPAPAAAPAAASQGIKRKAGSGHTCVECGATQTPQWREGPTGPKTLCNACGVRYGRAMQKKQKSGQTGPVAGGGGRGKGKSASETGPGSSGGGGRGGGKPKVPKIEPSVPEPVPRAESQRPMRQAAQVAQARTAAFARTGEFPDGAEEATLSGGTDGGLNQLPIAALDLLPSLSGGQQEGLDTSALSVVAAAKLIALAEGPKLGNSQLKGESELKMEQCDAAVKIEPLNLNAAAVDQTASSALIKSATSSRPPLSHPTLSRVPLQGPTGCDVSAFGLPALGMPPVGPIPAHNTLPLPGLQGMALPLEQLQGGAGKPQTSSPALPILGLLPQLRLQSCSKEETEALQPLLALLSNGSLPALQGGAMAVPRGGEYHSLAVQAAKYAPELKTVEGFFAGLDQLPPGVLPHGATAALEAVRESVDAANRESAAAEAAVSAVTQVYAVRQAIAERAREAAAAAGAELKGFLMQLQGLHGQAANRAATPVACYAEERASGGCPDTAVGSEQPHAGPQNSTGQASTDPQTGIEALKQNAVAVA